MAHCFGVKIILNDKDSPVSQDYTIGLYNVASENSEFRWAQSNVYAHTWTDGMIVAGGLSSFTTEIDLRQPGATALPGSGSVTIKNTRQFWKELVDRGIVLNGLRLEIWILAEDASYPYEESDYRIRTYYCQEPTWDSKVYTIPFKGGQERSVSNILLPVNSISFPYASSDTVGDIIPASFGRLLPKYDASGNIVRSTIAKGIKVSDYEDYTVYNNAWFSELESYPETNEYPVYWCASSESNDTDFVIIFRGGDIRTISEYLTINDAVYVYVSSGNGKGQYRRIVSWSNDGTPDTKRLCVYVDSYFDTPIQDKDGADPSWVKIIRIKKDYYFDHFPCKDYLSSDGNVIENAPELYTIVSEKLERALDYAYSSEGVIENNKAEIVPLLYSDDLETIDSMIIKPVESIYLNTATDLSVWNSSTYPDMDIYTHKEDGVYVTLPENLSISDKLLSSISFSYDKNYNTYMDFFLKGSATTPAGYEHYAKVLCFTLPEQPNVEWDSLLIGIKSQSKAEKSSSDGLGGSPIKIMLRRWIYGVNVNSIDTVTADEETGDGSTIYTIPDFYFVPTISFENKGYFGDPIGSDPHEIIYGQYVFTDITPNNYNSYIEGMIAFFRYTIGSDFYDDDTKIYELCFIFKKSGQDISKEILTPFAGRVFNDTWSSRKTSSNLIQNPVDILEHVCRLQNWSDRCSTPVSGWGLQYASSPLIATTGIGSFDDPDLISVRNYLAAAQIEEFDDGYTDEIKDKVCNDFSLANWQDKDGYERVLPLPSDYLSPVYTIHLSDIIDRSSIKISSISPSKIIAEPWVSYNWNAAKDDYDNKIEITNASAGTYTDSFVHGVIDSTQARNLWGSCHSLYLMCNKLNKPPKNKTDLTFANGDGGYSIAIDYLQRWVNWQFNDEVEFKTHFNIAASWNTCTPINLLFSHHTDNTVRNALVEKTEINPNPPYDMFIKAIMYA